MRGINLQDNIFKSPKHHQRSLQTTVQKVSAWTIDKACHGFTFADKVKTVCYINWTCPTGFQNEPETVLFYQCHEQVNKVWSSSGVANIWRQMTSLLNLLHVIWWAISLIFPFPVRMEIVYGHRPQWLETSCAYIAFLDTSIYFCTWPPSCKA